MGVRAAMPMAKTAPGTAAVRVALHAARADRAHRADDAAAGAGLAPLAKSADFAFEVVRPARPDGRTMVLLHGSGGDETSLVRLAARIAPHATLLGIRGRVLQDGRDLYGDPCTPTIRAFLQMQSTVRTTHSVHGGSLGVYGFFLRRYWQAYVQF